MGVFGERDPRIEDGDLDRGLLGEPITDRSIFCRKSPGDGGGGIDPLFDPLRVAFVVRGRDVWAAFQSYLLTGSVTTS